MHRAFAALLIVAGVVVPLSVLMAAEAMGGGVFQPAVAAVAASAPTVLSAGKEASLPKNDPRRESADHLGRG